MDTIDPPYLVSHAALPQTEFARLQLPRWRYEARVRPQTARLCVELALGVPFEGTGPAEETHVFEIERTGGDLLVRAETKTRWPTINAVEGEPDGRGARRYRGADENQLDFVWPGLRHLAPYNAQLSAWSLADAPRKGEGPAMSSMRIRMAEPAMPCFVIPPLAYEGPARTLAEAFEGILTAALGGEACLPFARTARLTASASYSLLPDRGEALPVRLAIRSAFVPEIEAGAAAAESVREFCGMLAGEMAKWSNLNCFPPFHATNVALHLELVVFVPARESMGDCSLHVVQARDLIFTGFEDRLT